LVGDAFHYESPLDGQGIYNALLASKFLAEGIQQRKAGRPWLEAGQEYQQRFYDTSYVMLKQTVKRVQQELYTEPPPFVINTLMRWVLTDPGYQKQFLRYLSRAIKPDSFIFGPTPGPIVRGFLRDVLGARQ
jgi:2-polyprenyl-6-methoxyphenol hydroxylase-like FAD-dependent oxidoreductase